MSRPARTRCSLRGPRACEPPAARRRSSSWPAAASRLAERARRELSATGETARKRTLDTRDVLTAQESQIAQLAREGLSNPEIGAQLFPPSRLSPA